MKTKNAFAFRDYDHNKFLQRPLFKFCEVNGERFLNGNQKSDKEILESFQATDDVDENEMNLRKLQSILERVLYCQEHMIDKRHIPRLIRFKRRTKNEKLKKRAGELYELYDEVAATMTMFQEVVKGDISAIEKIIEQQNRKKFAKRLKQARKESGLTQKNLAEKIGKTQNAINLYESGQREPPLTVLIRLSRILKESTDNLLGIST